MYRSRMPKLNQVNWLIKTIQETNCQIQVARYHIQIARTRVQAWTETKNLKSSTQSNHIQIISQSQTEGLLTRHCSVLQLSPIVKSSPNIDNPIPRAQTITHIIVSFVPQPTIIAKNVASWKCVLDPKQLVYLPRYALCGKRLNPVTMVSAIMSLINTDFVDFVDMFRYLITRSGVRFPCRKLLKSLPGQYLVCGPGNRVGSG